MRSTAGIEAIQALFPEPVILGLLLLTVLGNPFVAPPVLLGVYWFDDRRRGARLFGVVAGGLALTLVAKELFALPRPPASPPLPTESLPVIVRAEYAGSVRPDSNGFPSGHATTATLLWGGLALALEGAGSRLQRFGSAGAVILLVALSRVAMGVHYPADVVAGVAFGGVYLLAAGAVLARVRDESTAALVGSLGLATVAVAVAGPRPEAAAGVGIVVGALVGWYLAGGPRPPWSRLGDGTYATVGGIGLVAAVGAGWSTGGPVVVGAFLVPAAVFAVAIAGAGAVATASSPGPERESGGD